MKTNNRILLFALLLAVCLLILGCKGEDEEDEAGATSSAPPETAFIGHNNYSIIDGPAVGLNTVSNEELRKGLTVTLVNDNQYFTLGRSFATRGDSTITDSLYFHWILLVSNNTTNNAFCDIEVKTISFKEANGEDIPSTAINSKVYGSIGLVESKYFKSCLSPGEKGYVLQKVTAISTDFYSLVEGVEIDSISYRYSSVVTPNVTLLPRSYTYDSSNDIAAIVVKNMNEDDGYVWAGFSYILFMDGDGLPVFWSNLNQFSVVPFLLQKEESTTLTTEQLDFAGSVTKLKIIVGFGVDAWNPAWSIH